jgi:DNA-binding FadR family transcriptional regulator
MDVAGPEFVESMARFHQVLVESSGSESLTLVAGVIETIAYSNTVIWAREASGTDDDETVASKRRSLSYHEEICDLVERGDDARAFEVMGEHSADMCRVEEWLGGIDLSALVDPAVVRASP